MLKMIDGFPSTFGDDYQLNTNEFIRYAASTFPEVEVISRIFVSESMGSLIESVQETLDRVKGNVILNDEKQNELKTSLTPVQDYEQLMEKKA